MRFKNRPYADKDINGETIEEIEMADISGEAIENHVREYYIGNTKVAEGRRQDVRKLLEDKVVRRVGRKGKWIVDKLFELIEGDIYIVQQVDKVDGEVIKYYKRPPDLNAIIYALDRVLGKPKQVNIQASFSLSKLLVNVEKNKNNGLRRNDNDEIPAKPPLLHREGLGA